MGIAFSMGLLGAVIGFIAGFFAVAVFAVEKIKALKDKISVMEQDGQRGAYLASRIRAIQEQGSPSVKGERSYTIQKPDGRFGKFSLPEV